MSEPGYSKEDENRKTLELMGKYGIENVRGGDWCMVNMRQKTYRELEVKIGKPKSGKNWKYRPKTKSKPKPKSKPKSKSVRCKARTLYGQGPRCKLNARSGSDYCRVHAPYYPKKRRMR